MRVLAWIGAAAAAAFLWRWGYNVAARERATWAPVQPRQPDVHWWPTYEPPISSGGTTWRPTGNVTVTYDERSN